MQTTFSAAYTHRHFNEHRDEKTNDGIEPEVSEISRKKTAWGPDKYCRNKKGFTIKRKALVIMWRITDSNRRPLACHASALAN